MSYKTPILFAVLSGLLFCIDSETELFRYVGYALGAIALLCIIEDVSPYGRFLCLKASFKIRGIRVYTKDPKVARHMGALKNSPKFLNYVNGLDTKNHTISSIEIERVTMFGPTNVGFVYMTVSCVTLKQNPKTNKKTTIPGVVFLRGDSVATFITIKNKQSGKYYCLLVSQYRVPIGKYIHELVAGMLDKQTGDPTGKMLDEVYEETGIKLKKNDLSKLGVITLSPGGCDEKMDLFYTGLELDDDKIKRILSKTYGQENEGEEISLQLVALSDLSNMFGRSLTDAKLLSTIPLLPPHIRKMIGY